MSARTAGAVVATVLFVPAVASAQQPQTITITTTTTVTIAPDATISDGPPGETPVNTVGRAAEGIDRGFRFTAAGGLAAADDPVGLADLRIGWAIAHHVILGGGFTLATDGDDTIHLETASLQIWPTARFWLEGGAGVVTDKKVEGAGTVALGYELFARPTYSIGAQLRGFFALDGDGGIGSLLVGATFY
ncbi:MAG TPA: hypothetical protein VL463_04790 [Kofleriaceae bacterium]|jgi:hypothetical protein|nr:hypothetical protein [Kofleriaceae bacterium]